MSIRFTIANPAVADDHLRCDIIAVVGLLPRRAEPVPETWHARLAQLGLDRALSDAPEQRSDARGLPLRCDGWADVRALFAVGPGEVGAGCPCARFLRRYFAEGGRSAVVIHAGDPVALDADPIERRSALARVLRGRGDALDHLPDPNTIATHLPPAEDDVLIDGSVRDIGCLRILDSVAALCVPDLPWLLASDPPQPGLPPAGPMPEQFVPCSDESALDPYQVRYEGTPQLNIAAWHAWAAAIRDLRQRLDSMQRPDCLLISAFPVPTSDGVDPAEADTATLLEHAGLHHRALQLAWPWLSDHTDRERPADDPAAVVAGITARSTLERGCWSSLGHIRIAERSFLQPAADWARMPSEMAVRLIGIEPQPGGGLRLRHDRTTETSSPFCFGSVMRLHGMLWRACSSLGRDLTFEAHSDSTYRTLRLRLATLLNQVYRNGGLRGRSTSDAFQIICDRRSHSQHDIDNGRLIVELRYQPALPVEHIEVRFAVATGLPVEVV